jgi:hypothetical protein
MTRVRRRVLRATPPPAPAATSRRAERWQRQLTADRQSLRRWMPRLKRAFRTVVQLQGRIARLERQLGQSA